MASSGEPQKLTFGQKLSNGCRDFGKFLYNPETRQVMGRSKDSWGRIFVYLQNAPF